MIWSYRFYKNGNAGNKDETVEEQRKRSHNFKEDEANLLKEVEFSERRHKVVIGGQILEFNTRKGAV